MAIAAAGAVAALVGAGLAINSAVQANKREKENQARLRTLSQTPYKTFKVDPRIDQLYSQAMKEASNPQGFSGASTAMFNNAIGRIQRGRRANAMSLSGGQQSRAINSVLSGNESDALGNFAVQNENLMRSNRMAAIQRLQYLSGQYQNADNQNVGFANSYKLQTEQALGQSIRQQQDFQQQAQYGLGKDLMGAGISYGFSGSGGGDNGYNRNIGYGERLRYRTHKSDYMGTGQGVTPSNLSNESVRSLQNPRIDVNEYVPDYYVPSRSGRSSG